MNKSEIPTDLKPMDKMTALEMIQEARQIMTANRVRVSIRTRLLLRDLETRIKEFEALTK